MELKLARMVDYTITPKHIWGTREKVKSLYQEKYKQKGYMLYNVESLYSLGVVLKDAPQYGFLKARSLESKNTEYLVTQQEKGKSIYSTIAVEDLDKIQYWDKEIIEVEEAIVDGKVTLDEEMAGLACAVGIDEKPLLAPPNTDIINWFNISLDPNKVYFGIELEMMWGLNQEFLQKKLKQVEKSKTALPVEDPSVDAELVTIPMELKTMKDWLDKNQDLIHNIGIGEGVGAHIHISKVAFSSQYSMSLFSVLIHEAANEMRWMFGKEDSHAKIKKKTVSDWYNTDRYEAVNFLNKDTVEVRAFRGTNDKELIKARLNFLDYCIKYANLSINANFQEFLDWLYSQRNV